VWCAGPPSFDHAVVRFVGRLVISVLGNAVGLIVAAAALDGVSLTAGALLLDVLVFTGVALIVLPMIQKQAIRGSEAIAGSSALLACFVALVVTVLLSDGLRISGVGAWVGTTVIVWAVALVAGLLLPWLFLRRRIGGAGRGTAHAPNVRRRR
jgi:hypothetical protein